MTITHFKPTRDKVLVAPLWQTPQVGLIHVPEAYKETNPKEGTVVAVGPKCRDLAIGDRVLTEPYNGTWMEIGNKRYRLLDPVDVLALVEHCA